MRLAGTLELNGLSLLTRHTRLLAVCGPSTSWPASTGDGLKKSHGAPMRPKTTSSAAGAGRGPRPPVYPHAAVPVRLRMDGWMAGCDAKPGFPTTSQAEHFLHATHTHTITPTRIRVLPPPPGPHPPSRRKPAKETISVVHAHAPRVYPTRRRARNVHVRVDVNSCRPCRAHCPLPLRRRRSPLSRAALVACPWPPRQRRWPASCRPGRQLPRLPA